MAWDGLGESRGSVELACVLMAGREALQGGQGVLAAKGGHQLHGGAAALQQSQHMLLPAAGDVRGSRCAVLLRWGACK